MNTLDEKMEELDQHYVSLLQKKQESLEKGDAFQEEKEFQQLSQFMYSYDVYRESSIGNYLFIKEFMEKNGFQTIVDIGTAYGMQSELFRAFAYIGVDNTSGKEKTLQWREEEEDVTYIHGVYPCPLPPMDKATTLGVSVLCLTWNCYLYSDDALHEQLSALRRDFDHVLLYTPLTAQEMSPYFTVQHLRQNYYYLTTNKEEF